MGNYLLGPIRVVDNGDGIYHPPLSGSKKTQDKLTDTQGKPIKINGPKAQAALKLLGIKSLQGLRLTPASQYLLQLSGAEKDAKAGHTRLVQSKTLLARQAARKAGLPFAEARAHATLTSSLKKELTIIVLRARRFALQGKVVALRDTFNGARDILARLRIPLDQAKAKGLPFTQKLLAKLEHRAMVRALPILWKQGRAFARSGNVERTLGTIRQIEEYSLLTKTALGPRRKKLLKNLTKIAYAHSVNLHFKRAAKKARAGDLAGTWIYLNRAKEASQLARQTWTQARLTKARKILEECLYRSPLFLFSQAQDKARNGKVAEVRQLIQQARDNRKLINKPLPQSFEPMAKQLINRALIFSVDILLGKAGRAAWGVSKRGNMAQVHAYINEAKKNASLAKILLSAAQKTSIKQISGKAFKAAISWRYRQAAYSAERGKVDDTTVPLNEARALSKRAGLTFDKGKAHGLIRQALTKGIELHFNTARAFAKAGDKVNTYLHLDTVRDYFRRLGTVFDTQRGHGILQFLKK